MYISATHSHLPEICVKFLRHSLCQGCHQNTFVQLCTFPYLFQKVIHLIFCRPYLDRRIQQSCRSHHLLHHKSFGFFEFILSRSRTDEYLLPRNSLKFIELQRPVVGCGRQAEAVFHKDGFPGMVTAIHCPDLRKSHMALIYESDEVLREIIYQTERTHTLASTIEIA